MNAPPVRLRNPFPALIFVIGVRLLITLYWLSRFGGLWVEEDTSRTSVSIDAVFETGKLYGDQLRVYTNGFLYQVWVTVLSRVTGMSVIDLQHWVLPFFGIFISVVAFTFYLRIFNNPSYAAVATILLNIQGDFILTTMRGSHEKVDFLLILASLLVLVLSVQWFDTLRERIALAVIYYMLILAQNTANVFFASTFTAMLVLSFILWKLVAVYMRRKTPGITWMLYISLLAIVFAFIVIFVWYPPARAIVLAAEDMRQRVVLFLFSPEELPAEFLAAANLAWVFPNAWLYLRFYDILLMLIAGIGWILLVVWMRQTKEEALSPMVTSYFWLVILLPAFAIQNAVVIFSDLTGSTGDINNLQIRLIPITAFLAAPTATFLLFQLIRKLRTYRRAYITTAATVIFVLVLALLAGLIKGISEPALSNVWLFYFSSEDVSIRWLNNAIPRITFDNGRRTPAVWIGSDYRLGSLWVERYWGISREQIPIVYHLNDYYTYVLISPAIRLAASRAQITIPDLRQANLIYDNGYVQIYFDPVENR